MAETVSGSDLSFDINIPETAVPLLASAYNFTSSLGYWFLVDWGDGGISYANSLGSNYTDHIYSSYGTYDVVVHVLEEESDNILASSNPYQVQLIEPDPTTTGGPTTPAPTGTAPPTTGTPPPSTGTTGTTGPPTTGTVPPTTGTTTQPPLTGSTTTTTTTTTTTQPPIGPPGCEPCLPFPLPTPANPPGFSLPTTRTVAPITITTTNPPDVLPLTVSVVFTTTSTTTSTTSTTPEPIPSTIGPQNKNCNTSSCNKLGF